jgi:hypothetical protein
VERASAYSILGIPDGLSTALVLVWLSLSLAPWLGGAQIGPLTIPRLGKRANRVLGVVGPVVFFLFAFGFLRLWRSNDVAAITHDAYIATFFDGLRGVHKNPVLKGSLFVLNEAETSELQTVLGNSAWEGGNWGTVSFDPSGRLAKYTNQQGRSPGHILIQGFPPGTVPLILGEWHQDDGQNGQLILALSPGLNDLQLLWGPAFAAKSRWKRSPTKSRSHG